MAGAVAAIEAQRSEVRKYVALFIVLSPVDFRSYGAQRNQGRARLPERSFRAPKTKDPSITRLLISGTGVNK